MKEPFLFFFVILLHFYFEKNDMNHASHYFLYSFMAIILIMTYRALRYSH